MSLTTIDANSARAMIKAGAVLVDIRDADEHAREHIAKALHIPLPKLRKSVPNSNGKPLIFHCKSGNRTRMNAGLLSKAGEANVYVLDGGIEGWKTSGHPVQKDRMQPIEIIRQVQIAAGTFVLTGASLGFIIHSGFYALSAAVGAGLLFSGISGTCVMASALKRMPWNSAAT